MGRSLLFRNFNQAMQITHYCKKNNITNSQGIELLAELTTLMTREQTNLRRHSHTAVSYVDIQQQPQNTYLTAKMGQNAKIGIVGAGLAGLACGYQFKQHGIFATVYEASNRVGGRCFSLGGSFPGAVNFPNQVVERGGEFIDSQNKTLLGLAKKFNLTLNDVSSQPGEVVCYFNGHRFTQSAIIDEYRDFLAAIDADLRLISSKPTADNHTPTDVWFDNISLLEYLEIRQPGELVKAIINSAYMAEYGLELEQQSCLNFLLVVHEIEKSKATPFHIFSDECYHIAGGNEQIVRCLSNELEGQINLGMKLVRVRKNSMNSLELTFDNGSQTISVEYDAVVLAIPFSVLRQVELDASLELPTWKLEAINKLDNATHAKMMIGFNGRPWVDFDSNGASNSNLPNHQVTWEANPTGATSDHAVLVDYSSGKRGATLNAKGVQAKANLFLRDLEKIYPPAIAAASRDQRGNLLAHLEHWASNPLAQGSYACYKPGQFTTIAGNEGKAIDNLYFAGEHTNSFYEWQGYMEGAAVSGIQAANGILQHLKLKILRC